MCLEVSLCGRDNAVVPFGYFIRDFKNSLIDFKRTFQFTLRWISKTLVIYYVIFKALIIIR